MSEAAPQRPWPLRPGAATFGMMFATGAFGRALVMTLIPLEAYVLLENERNASLMFMSVALVNLVASFGVPALIHRFRRRRVYWACGTIAAMGPLFLAMHEATALPLGALCREFAGTSLLIAVFMSLQASRSGTGPFAATIGAIRNAPIEELFSIWLAIGAVAMILAISGVLLSRLLWHWKTAQLVFAWAGVLVVVSFLPLIVPVAEWEMGALSRDLVSLWPSRLQALAMCWVATAAGVPIDRITAPAKHINRKFRRSMRWARKQVNRRQTG